MKFFPPPFRVRHSVLLAFVLAAAFGHEARANAAEFSFADFERKVREGKPNRVSELLAALPANVLARAVVVQDSGSLQDASPAWPRILVFGGADFVFSFNGGAHQRGYEALEVLHFDPEGARFTLEEFTFAEDREDRRAYLAGPLANADPSRLSFERRELGDRRNREGKNPELCLQCHGRDPHPLVPPYPFGRGLLGGYRGIIDPSASWLPSLRRNFVENPRYRRLPLLRLVDDHEARQTLHDDFAARMQRLNWERLANRLAERKDFAFWRDRVMRALENGGGETEEKLESLVSATREARARAEAEERALIIEQKLFTLPALPALPDVELWRIARARSVLEEGMSVSMSEDFAADDRFAAYLFEGPGTSLANLAPALRRRLGPQGSPR